MGPGQNPLAMLAALRAQQGGQPGGPQPMAGGQGPQTPPQGPQGPAGAPGQGPQQLGMPGVQPPQRPATEPGQTGDATKPLLAAIQNLHAYIALSTDPREINVIRNLISMITNLVARDQQKAAVNPANQINAAENPQPTPGASAGATSNAPMGGLGPI